MQTRLQMSSLVRSVRLWRFESHWKLTKINYLCKWIKFVYEFQGYFSVEGVLIKPRNRNTFNTHKNYTESPIIPIICHHCHMVNCYLYLHCWFMGVSSAFLGCFDGISSVFQTYFKDYSWISKVCYKGVLGCFCQVE